MDKMQNLFYTYVDLAVIENGMTLPPFINENAEVITSDDINPMRPTMLSVILEKCQNRHMLVFTESDFLFNMLKTVNSQKNDHFIGVLCKRQWESDGILEELHKLENTLVDTNHVEHCMEEQLLPDVFATDTDYIVMKTSEDVALANLPLTKKHIEEPFGVLLTDSAFRRSRFLGVFGNIQADIYTKALLLADICDQIIQQGLDKMPVFEKVLAFQGGCCLVTEFASVEHENFNSAFTEFCFRTLFDKSSYEVNDLTEIILASMKTCILPDYLLHALEQAYLKQIPVSFQKWNLLFHLLSLEEYERNISYLH